MYLAIGADLERVEACDHPKHSPYMQHAMLLFATGEAEAKSKAKKLLGSATSVITQIGYFSADVSGQRLHTNTNSEAAQVNWFHVGDYNDTDEGILVCVNTKARSAKAGR